jgi:hypothetical protein
MLNVVVASLRSNFHSAMSFVYFGACQKMVRSPGNVRCLEKLKSDIRGHRVLVLGTGPSARLVQSDVVAAFDSVVAINHALKLHAFSLVPREKRFFFCADENRLLQLFSCGFFRELPKQKKLYCAAHMTTPLRHRKLLREMMICMPKTGRMDWKKYTLIPSFGWREPSPLEVASDMRGERLITLESFHGSSLFHLLAVLSKCGVSEVSLAGCDMSSGRVDELLDELGAADHESEKKRRQLQMMVQLMQNAGINVFTLKGDEKGHAALAGC